MTINDSLLTRSEKILFTLRELYCARGYRPYRMGKFEEYDLYADNKDFLVSDNVITFTDTNGKLMALKPDVTLSIIKNSTDLPGEVQKVCYNENVYRVSKGTNSYKELMQAGVECFGNVTEAEIDEVICLAVQSLASLSPDSVLELSDLDLTQSLLDAMQIPQEKHAQVYAAIGEKNLHELEAICLSCCAPRQTVELLRDLISLHGPVKEVLPKMETMYPSLRFFPAFTSFTDTLRRLSLSDAADRIEVDLSVVDDVHYYNGIVFKGFLRGIPTAVISGGQYDRLMQKLRRHSRAIGFAVYTDTLDRLPEENNAPGWDGYLNVALPKGRLGEKVYAMFAAAGYDCPSILEQNRKLIFENAEKKIRYFWVKPSDVAIYVERGAADIGVAGKDILLEYRPDVYELSDLDIGKCRMAVAAPKGFADDPSRTLIVATKFSRIAQDFYRSRGRDIDIIHLNGSIEIAPILGLSDVIVDIVETGTTLKENDLEVVETIVTISARLISIKAAFKFKSDVIEDIARCLARGAEETK